MARRAGKAYTFGESEGGGQRKHSWPSWALSYPTDRQTQPRKGPRHQGARKKK